MLCSTLWFVQHAPLNSLFSVFDQLTPMRPLRPESEYKNRPASNNMKQTMTSMSLMPSPGLNQRTEITNIAKSSVSDYDEPPPLPDKSSHADYANVGVELAAAHHSSQYESVLIRKGTHRDRVSWNFNIQKFIRKIIEVIWLKVLATQYPEWVTWQYQHDTTSSPFHFLLCWAGLDIAANQAPLQILIQRPFPLQTKQIHVFLLLHPHIALHFTQQPLILHTLALKMPKPQSALHHHISLRWVKVPTRVNAELFTRYSQKIVQIQLCVLSFHDTWHVQLAIICYILSELFSLHCPRLNSEHKLSIS